MSDPINLRKNPSRETCEDIIRRILEREMALKGKNDVFKQASDFLPFFESLYPASNSLTKQVQRAIKALKMPKDEKGYYIPNKTEEQYKQELLLHSLLKESHTIIKPIDNSSALFLNVLPEMREYLISSLSNNELLKDQIITAIKTFNGILIYSNNSDALYSSLKKILIS